MQIDRMALADLGHPVAIAEAVIAQLANLAPPIPIEEIAVAVGITDIAAIDTSAFEGALIATDDKRTGTILVRESNRPERRRFTIGHELGHYLSPWHQPPAGGFKCSAQDMRTSNEQARPGRSKLEAEANEFAAEILMPKSLFTADLRRMKEPGLEHVVELASRYHTSKIATGRRFIALQGDRKALIVSKDAVISQCYREHGFPFIALNRGQAVHRKSLTSTFQSDRETCSDVEPCESSYWLSNQLRSNQELFEQVLVQGGGYRITLLSIDFSEDEEEDYAEERSAWNPTFKRR